MKNLLFLLVALAVVGCSGADSNGSGGGGGSGAAGGSNPTASGGGDASGGGGASTNTGGAGGAAQGGGGQGTGGSAPAATVHMTVTPDMMQAGETVTAHVSVTHFVLEAPVGQPNQAGHGHYHIYLDGATSGDYLVANQVPSIAVQIPQGTSVGAHTLRVSLGENDHTPLSPAVQEIVDITVVAP